jgi:hypothetical protein
VTIHLFTAHPGSSVRICDRSISVNTYPPISGTYGKRITYCLQMTTKEKAPTMTDGACFLGGVSLAYPMRSSGLYVVPQEG